MPRTGPDPNSPHQRRLAILTPIVREMDKLTAPARGRVLTFVAALVEDDDTAAEELRAMRSIAYRLQKAEPDDRARIVRELHEDYGQPNHDEPKENPDGTITLPTQGRPVTRTP